MAKKNFLSHDTQREAVYLAHELMNAGSNEERRRHLARLLEALEVTPEAQADGEELFAAVHTYRRRKRILVMRQRAMAQRTEAAQ